MQIIDKIDYLNVILDNSNKSIITFEDWKLTMAYLLEKYPENLQYQESICDYFTKFIKKNSDISIS